MKKRSVILLSAFVVVVLAGAWLSSVAEPQWKHIDDNAYMLIRASSGKFVAARVLEDTDRRQLVDAISNPGPHGGALKPNSAELRKAWMAGFSQLKTLRNDSLVSTSPETFEAVFDTVDGSVSHTFFKIDVGGRAIAVPEEVDSLPFEFVVSSDGSVSLVATQKGLWRIDAHGMAANKISSDRYNGRTYEELRESMNAGVSGDQRRSLFWNISPKISPDSCKVVYCSNRDATTADGYSVWLYDLKSGEEKVIAASQGESYRCEGWLDSETVLCQRFVGVDRVCCTVSCDGKVKDLDFGVEAPKFLGTSAGLVAYTVGTSASAEVRIVKCDSASGQLSYVCSMPIGGSLRGTGAFNDQGTRFAYLYAPDEDDTTRWLGVVDLRHETGTSTSSPQSSQHRSFIKDFTWIKSNELFVDVSSVTSDGIVDEASWIYRLGGIK